MLPKIVIFAVCITAVVARTSAVFGGRQPRSVGGGATSSSYSSSSSSSSSGSGGDVFRFPTPVPAIGTFPAFGMNNAFQRFIESANAAHIAASQDPIFQKIYQQQMAILATLQQMAWNRYPFAFPGFEASNAVGGGAGAWNNGLGTRTGSEPSVFTSGMVSFGTPGGVGVVSSFPGGPDGLGTRIAEEFPAPSGTGTFGTFSSSASGVSNINGETKSYKTSTIGVNDNGRITFRTV